MKYRLKFTKLGCVKFIGHLDLITIFQRALKRANLPVAYSQGFNPHQLISFAFPLSVGYESICEYVDIEVTKEVAIDIFISSLNRELPGGIEVIGCMLLDVSDKNAMSLVVGARYEAVCDFYMDIVLLKNHLDDFLQQTEIFVVKKVKKVTKEINIRDDIKQLSVFLKDGFVVLDMLVSAGSVRNLKPDFIVRSFYNFLDLPFDIYKISIKRTELCGFRSPVSN